MNKKQSPLDNAYYLDQKPFDAVTAESRVVGRNYFMGAKIIKSSYLPRLDTAELGVAAAAAVTKQEPVVDYRSG